jgi:hypothetical protein
MRSYFKVWYKEGIFYATQQPLNLDRGDLLLAVTPIVDFDRKRNFVQYMNQIYPYASTTAGAIAVSQIGLNDYVTYRTLHPE